MKLTPEQKDAILHPGNVSLIACPGSGKTQTLITKLASCLEEVVGTSRKIACITYTNSAANEVQKRLSNMGIQSLEDYCDISTIHAFCLNYIIKYFHWKIDHYRESYIVLPPDSDEYKDITKALIRKYNLDRRHAPDQFELLNREVDGTPITNWPLTPKIALEFWNILEQEGYIDFTNILYWSCKLIQDNTFISNALASKYAWFLIDEFQDTTSLQVEIFTEINNHNSTNFFIVGDPHQSIYRFAGARPILFDVFKDRIQSTPKYLTGNWRSSQIIINDAESLSPRTNPMKAVGKYKNFLYEPEWWHCDSIFQGITDYFLPILEEHSIDYGNAAILAPWWIKLLHLGRSLREYGVPIIGPGARPYRRSHLIAPLAEELGAFIKNNNTQRIYNIERELFVLLNNFGEHKVYSIYTYMGKVVIYELIKSAIKTYEECAGSGKRWIIEMSTVLSDILLKHELVTTYSHKEELLESSQKIIEEMSNNGIDVENLSVEDLGLFAIDANSIHLLTMHRSKGMEFDAVALIDLHDGRLPHFTAQTKEEIEDSMRLFYVTITRAKKVLMYFTDKEDSRNKPSPFLGNWGLGYEI